MAAAHLDGERVHGRAAVSGGRGGRLPRAARPGARFGLLGGALIAGLGVGVACLQATGVVSGVAGTAVASLACLGLFGAFCSYQRRLVGPALERQRLALASLRDVARQRGKMMQADAAARARLGGVLQAAVDYAIIGTDAAGTITVFSDGAARMLGYRAEEVVGTMTPTAFLDAEELAERALALHQPAGVAALLQLAGRAASSTSAWTFIARCGRRLPVSLTLGGIRDDHDQMIGLVGVARDLTTERRSQEQRDNLLRIGQELLCVVTPDAVLRHVNPAFTRILGHPAAELLGRSVFDFVHPDDCAATRKCVTRIIGGELIQRFENRWRHRDGSYRWISWDCSVCFFDGSLYGGGWDVTAEKARAVEAARQAQFEQRLIGIVSHDLRNPLNVIALAADQIMRQTALPPQARRMAARIVRTGARAERLLGDLLDFTQARHGGLPIHVQATDVDACLAGVLEEMRLLHPERPLHVRRWCGSALRLDPDRVAQAVGNLLTNAMRYGPAGTPVSVTVAPNAAGGGITIAVHNVGPPIDPALLPRLFRPLQRGDAAAAAGGVGLGLYIVQQVARAHGGEVSVTSTAAEGTTFALRLPHTCLGMPFPETAAAAHPPGRGAGAPLCPLREASRQARVIP